jgi:hypothetical protein
MVWYTLAFMGNTVPAVRGQRGKSPATVDREAADQAATREELLDLLRTAYTAWNHGDGIDEDERARMVEILNDSGPVAITR